MTEPKDLTRALVKSARNILDYPSPSRLADVNDVRVLLLLAIDQLSKPWAPEPGSCDCDDTPLQLMGPMVDKLFKTSPGSPTAPSAELQKANAAIADLVKALEEIATPMLRETTYKVAMERKSIAKNAIAAYKASTTK